MATANQKPRPRIDWWVYGAAALALIQCALFAVPHTRPGGFIGITCWYLGLGLMPWLAGLLAICGLIRSAWRRPFWRQWRVVGFLGLTAIAASSFGFRVYPSSHDGVPSRVAFRLPLDGPITVGWGGATPDLNAHVSVPDQRWAYDLVVTRDGKTRRGTGKSLGSYYCYGQPVLAPASGTVYATFDGDPDMPPGRLGGGHDSCGNQVVLQVAPDEFLFLCHLQRGSVRVKPGQRVAAGEPLARVGNSGNSSEPHLHLHLQDTPTLLLGEGIPLEFRNYRTGGGIVARGMPTGGVKGGKLVGQVVENVPQGR
jgi:murein DD-endopeptidase MepM/ murein hydrolase activator NlpD